MVLQIWKMRLISRGHPCPQPQNPSSGTDDGRREKEEIHEYALKIFTYRI